MSIFNPKKKSLWLPTHPHPMDAKALNSPTFSFFLESIDVFLFSLWVVCLPPSTEEEEKKKGGSLFTTSRLSTPRRSFPWLRQRPSWRPRAHAPTALGLSSTKEKQSSPLRRYTNKRTEGGVRKKKNCYDGRPFWFGISSDFFFVFGNHPPPCSFRMSLNNLFGALEVVKKQKKTR